MRQGGILLVCVDLFDDRVATVGGIGGDGVRGAGGEERMEPLRLEQGGPAWPGSVGRFRSGIRPTTSRPVICSAFFFDVNAVKEICATAARDTN